MEHHPKTTAPASRWLFGISGLLVSLYFLNVGLRFAAVKFGASPWRVGDVGEMLLVLFGMVFFVAALLVDEDRSAATGNEGESNSTQGGVR